MAEFPCEIVDSFFGNSGGQSAVSKQVQFPHGSHLFPGPSIRQNLFKLGPDSHPRHPLQSGSLVAEDGERLGAVGRRLLVGSAVGAGAVVTRRRQLRAKPEVAEDSLVVFANAVARLADEANPSAPEIFLPAMIVYQVAVEREEHGVDSQVALTRVQVPVARESPRESAAADGFRRRRSCGRVISFLFHVDARRSDFKILSKAKSVSTA